MVVVDYKTDTLDTPKRVEDAATRHRTQMGLYAWETQEVTGKAVREAVAALPPSLRKSSLSPI